MPVREYIPDAADTRAAPHKYRNLNRASIATLTTVEECDEAIDYVTKSLTHIKQQISRAKRAHAAEGIKSDWEWLTRTESAKSVMGYLHQELLRHRATLAKAKKIAQNEAANRERLTAFVRIVRSNVDRDTFLKWMSEAEMLASIGGDA